MVTLVEKWIEQGFQQGVGYGLVEGVMHVLQQCFDWYPAGLAEQLANRPRPELETLFDAAALAPDPSLFCRLCLAI